MIAYECHECIFAHILIKFYWYVVFFSFCLNHQFEQRKQLKTQMSKNINHKKISNVNDIFKIKYFNKLIFIYLLFFNIEFALALLQSVLYVKGNGCSPNMRHSLTLMFGTPQFNPGFCSVPWWSIYSLLSCVFSTIVCISIWCLFCHCIVCSPPIYSDDIFVIV